MLHIPQGTAHVRNLISTWTGSHRGPRNSLLLFLGGTVGAQWAFDSAIGTGFYKLLSVFANLYTPHMTQFYMPTFCDNRNNSKQRPLVFILVRYPFGNPWLRWLQWANFSVEDTHVIRTRDTEVCSTSLLALCIQALLVCSPAGRVMDRERVYEIPGLSDRSCIN